MKLNIQLPRVSLSPLELNIKLPRVSVGLIGVEY